MDRRSFSRTVAAAIGYSTLHPLSGYASSGWYRSIQGLRIHGPRLHRSLEDLSAFGARADGGVDRLAFSDADIQARGFVMDLMAAAGLEVRTDEVGNIFGRLEGTDPDLPPIWAGSHIDSVPAGGNYDGPLGTLGALEAMRTLADAGLRPRHPMDVVVFVNEEGGKTGSRILAGEFRDEELGLVSASGYTIEEGIRRLGGDPSRLGGAALSRGAVAGYLEIHVEQGAILDRAGVQIGVVEGIVGIRRWRATVRGSANHAGTTPMDQRQDALLGGAQLVQAVNRSARALEGSQVATVGMIDADPGAPNVIPGKVVMSIEIRALTMDRIQEVMNLIEDESEALEAEFGTPVEIEEFYLSGAAPTDKRFRRWVEGAAADLELTHQRMPSGAGHDAQAVAHFAPMGMIFIPSVGGLSHHPDEYSRPEDIEAGVNVLLHALLRADQELP